MNRIHVVILVLVVIVLCELQVLYLVEKFSKNAASNPQSCQIPRSVPSSTPKAVSPYDEVILKYVKTPHPSKRIYFTATFVGTITKITSNNATTSIVINDEKDTIIADYKNIPSLRFKIFELSTENQLGEMGVENLKIGEQVEVREFELIQSKNIGNQGGSFIEIIVNSRK